jgi:hypothetical protein
LVVSRSVSAPWASIWSRVMTEMACGVSISGVSVLVAVAPRLATKPVTGPVAVSPASLETVTVGSALRGSRGFVLFFGIGGHRGTECHGGCASVARRWCERDGAVKCAT